MNPLIRPVNQHVEIETLAPRTIINWEPLSNTGSITYECSDYNRMTEDGSYFGQPVPSGGISVSLSTVMNEIVDVEVSPGVFQPIPLVLVAGALKAHFKKHLALQRNIPV